MSAKAASESLPTSIVRDTSDKALRRDALKAKEKTLSEKAKRIGKNALEEHKGVLLERNERELKEIREALKAL